MGFRGRPPDAVGIITFLGPLMWVAARILTVNGGWMLSEYFSRASVKRWTGWSSGNLATFTDGSLGSEAPAGTLITGGLSSSSLLSVLTEAMAPAQVERCFW